MALCSCCLMQCCCQILMCDPQLCILLPFRHALALIPSSASSSFHVQLIFYGLPSRFFSFFPRASVLISKWLSAISFVDAGHWVITELTKGLELIIDETPASGDRRLSTWWRKTWWFLKKACVMKLWFIDRRLKVRRRQMWVIVFVEWNDLKCVILQWLLLSKKCRINPLTYLNTNDKKK